MVSFYLQQGHCRTDAMDTFYRILFFQFSLLATVKLSFPQKGRDLVSCYKKLFSAEPSDHPHH